MRTRTIDVEINSNSLRILRYKQYDHNNILEVILKKNKEVIDLTSYAIRVFFTLPNKTIIQRDAVFKDKKIIITIESILLENPGKIPTEITMSNGDEVVTIFTMYLEVEPSIDRNAAIIGNPEWDIIKDGLSSLDDKVSHAELESRLGSIDVDVPTKTSELINDSGFLTDIPTEYITEEELDKKGYLTEHQNLENYYNKSEVDKKIADIISGGEIDLDGYAKKEDLDKKADNLFKSDMLTVSSLGGISAGTDLNNMSLQEILTKLLYPYIAPSVTASIVYSPTGGIYEYGQTVTISQIKATVTKKSENILDVGFYENGSLLKSLTSGVSNGGSFNHTISKDIKANISNSYFQVKVRDASENTVSANTSSLNFYYPYYYGVINADVNITENLIKGLTKQVVSKGNKTYAYNPNYQRMVIAYPKSYGALKSILDPNGFEQLNSFTCIELSIVGLDKTSQTYYVYANDASTNTNFKMTFYY